MDEHAKDYYKQYSKKSPKGNFHTVIPLHESPDVDWGTFSKTVSNLPRGWFELCELPVKDRIQFSLDFWMLKIPYSPNRAALVKFFDALDDIGVYIVQKKFDDPMDAEMVYSLSNNRGFYRGRVPATDKEILDLQKQYPNVILPADYLAFLQIHDGFCKTTDCTGITSINKLYQTYLEFQMLLESRTPVQTKSGEQVNPKSLIPFYTSFGMPFFQCFWAEWYPQQEMGNVYYSSSENTITDPSKRPSTGGEEMSFPTFTDWLMFYLERIET